MMNNNYGYFNQNPQMGFAPQNGLVFNNLAPAKVTSSTPEELDIIRKNAGESKFNFTAEDNAFASWDFREGSNLCIQIVDAATDRVRIKYSDEEFNIVLTDDDVLAKALEIIKNYVYTTKLLNTNLDPNTSKELYRAAGVLFKLLPTAYSSGRKNYNNVINQARQQVGVAGYQGGWNQNMMWNGQFGTAPNYFVNDSSVPPQPQMMGYGPQGYQQYPQGNGQIDPNTLAQAMVIAQQMNAGAPTQPNGGTMMGGNPFVQGGQPQQTPQMTGSVPFPGAQPTAPTAPTAGTPQFNPPIGAPVQNANAPATTASAPF